jgi:hypothetical protein
MTRHYPVLLRTSRGRGLERALFDVHGAVDQARRVAAEILGVPQDLVVLEVA